NSIKIICKDPQNKTVIQLGRINPAQCLTLGMALDINMMTEADFVLLPGVGPVLAHRIVLARQLNGGFGSINDLLQVEGIGEKKFNQLSAYFNLPIQQKK
ncbi:helix-hairpin-helix domain-containing protein, partial [bacterium]|nr:helix-hairpin-helix domain-containing protein [bacterium]